MITPEEIDLIEFKRSFRGYSEDEVDDFLDKVQTDYEALIKENEALKEKLQMYESQISKYSSIEETLKETLITAQSAAEDTTSAANKKARVIVQEAELEAKKIVDLANNKVVEIRNEYESLVKEFKVFRTKFKSLLEDEMQNVDDIFSEIIDSRDGFTKINTNCTFDGTGTMRMSVLEDVQEEEEKTVSAIEVEEVVVESEGGTPEDIFKIK